MVVKKVSKSINSKKKTIIIDSNKVLSDSKNNFISKDIFNLNKSFSEEKILIVSVDRDNDIGQKIDIEGPIIGFNKNIKVVTEFAITDPEDSDANCIFGALKKYRELSKNKIDVEIVTLTGHSKENMFFSDKNIVNQLKKVLEVYPATGIIFISDGAEDDAVLPILQNYVPILSKETIIVRQSRSLESTFYTIKKALRDPFFARIVYGIPAIIFLLFVFVRSYALQIIGFLAGFYFLIKGFRLDKFFLNLFNNLKFKFSFQRISFPFYLASLFFIIFGIFKVFNLFALNDSLDLLYRLISIFRAVILYFVLGFITFNIASIIDIFYFKKVFLLGKNIFSLFSILIIASILDFSLQLFINEITLTYFIFVILFSVILLLLLSRFTKMFDISSDVTSLLIGLPVFSKYGLFLGEVVSIDGDKNIIRFKDKTTNGIKSISKKNFYLEKGKVII
ncbi:MAG: DUF373 family protein [Candidatus ainarchaeum sp.]|nr:DUF373 family protein [Candidatus ainarchaeum sp.]MDD3975844.1 DUF373 family protein [Candidatus ainarchaeum sp.]